jgi:L-lactate dehydrogenase complex protein LldF
VNHPAEASQFVANDDRAHWHDGALWFVRSKRDRAASAIPEWEQLRELASQIKEHTISRLGEYLEQFEENATKLGATVHWARDGDEHNQIVHDILSDHGVTRVVKSKSMLTEECHLNPYLTRQGIQVVDTDLGEWIVQLRDEAPSHIVLPAIHIKKEEVGELFHEKIGTEQGAADPQYLTEAARLALRKHFLEAEAGITGVNFAIAETGGIVICTNEGNADMGTGLAKLHIACMGLEKLVPRAKDLGVFLRLLARSATGQPITSYSSHFHGPIEGGELHIVLVDNGRSEVMKKDEFRRSLNCIRCGACMNTCPVFRRSGGHSYGYTVPGPIGSILAPSRDAKEFYTLPYASSLCGSCTDVCPVKIDLHHQLLLWRREIAARKVLPWRKRFAMKFASAVLRRTWLYRIAGKLVRVSTRLLPRFLVYNRLNPWGRQRELPPMPKQSFRSLYAKYRDEK